MSLMSLINKLSRILFIAIAIGIIALSVCISVYKRPNAVKREPGPKEEEDMAKPDEFPYHVSIQYQLEHFCSGALVSPKHVLTVAHGLNEIPKSEINDVKVVVGTFYIPGGTTYEVEAIEVHPDFDATNFRSSVAVVRLKQMVTQTDYVKTINLPNRGQIVPHGQKIVISSFHLVRRPNYYAYLKKSTEYTANKDICDERRGRFFEYWDLSQKFCAFLIPHSTSSIEDRGSPATVDRKYVIGIFVSFSLTYYWGIPDYFIDVSSYLDFIRKATNKN